ncbi:thylakoid lumenal 15 kDa protein 1, chloroplastic isoform X2 [Senna tora]|uniref:Thylakoid lumenal 15 kDa protein 1, chloroplastic isoform X2 n=1 Tax=Senna tora TaxID=362788 RepID=A0A834WMW0_9FABA|nr:thylakoid lumenal 15 kDa protein 1, chloroplastic isoform X2 [Senna tora]
MTPTRRRESATTSDTGNQFLQKSILRQANFKGAKLLGASFFDADLTATDPLYERLSFYHLEIEIVSLIPVIALIRNCETETHFKQ